MDSRNRVVVPSYRTPEPDAVPDPRDPQPRPPTGSEADPVDETLIETFPASDPPQWWAGRP